MKQLTLYDNLASSVSLANILTHPTVILRIPQDRSHAMLATDPTFIAWEQKARPELLRSIQQRDGYPPTDSEDDLALMEDCSLDQAAILCTDILAMREAMVCLNSTVEGIALTPRPASNLQKICHIPRTCSLTPSLRRRHNQNHILRGRMRWLQHQIRSLASPRQSMLSSPFPFPPPHTPLIIIPSP